VFRLVNFEITVYVSVLLSLLYIVHNVRSVIFHSNKRIRYVCIICCVAAS